MKEKKENNISIFKIGALIETNKSVPIIAITSQTAFKNASFVPLPPHSIMLYLGSKYRSFPRLEFADNHQLEIISEKIESELVHCFLFKDKVIEILDDMINLQDDLDYANNKQKRQ